MFAKRSLMPCSGSIPMRLRKPRSAAASEVMSFKEVFSTARPGIPKVAYSLIVLIRNWMRLFLHVYRNTASALIGCPLALHVASSFPLSAAPTPGVRTVHFPPANADVPRLLAERQRQQAQAATAFHA